LTFSALLHPGLEHRRRPRAWQTLAAEAARGVVGLGEIKHG